MGILFNERLVHWTFVLHHTILAIIRDEYKKSFRGYECFIRIQENRNFLNPKILYTIEFFKPQNFIKKFFNQNLIKKII